MRVNIQAGTLYMPHCDKTQFEVVVYVHDEPGGMGRKVLYKSDAYAQQPDENMNLNLWIVATLRGLVARLEEDFVYTDERPPAVLIDDVRKEQKD